MIMVIITRLTRSPVFLKQLKDPSLINIIIIIMVVIMIMIITIIIMIIIILTRSPVFLRQLKDPSHILPSLNFERNQGSLFRSAG